MTDIAILHDQFRTLGGAERVGIEMARALDAPIYAARRDAEVVPDDLSVRVPFDSRVGEWAMDQHYLAQDAWQMLAWQQVPELRDYDVLIANKTNPLWNVPQEEQTLVQYCHSTPRGLYDQFARNEFGVVDKALKMAMRGLYSTNRTEPDAIACNSALVQRRCELYWSRPDARVIHPPVRVSEYGPEHAENPVADYLLAVSRLRDHKRLDELVAAADEVDRRVLIAGEGPARERLQAMAPANVTFLGYVDEQRKRRLMAEAAAFVFSAENEDFGITPIEAMASGTPVIGVNDGFTRYQIRDGKNGLLYPRGSGNLVQAVEKFDDRGVQWDADRLQAFAERFSVPRFHQELHDWIARAREATRIRPTWESEPEVAERSRVVADGGEDA